MRPENLKTKIFLDGGDPNETKEIIALLGFLDGQTTNPTLIAKNPQAQEKISRGEKFTEEEIYDFYKKIVSEISSLIPDGSISIEVYADASTGTDVMFTQGKQMNAWIPNAHIKLPISHNGLEAAARCIAEGMRVNMTLCFSQSQAAAVHAATRGAVRGQVFLSPFVGRLDDIGENGMDFIKNVLAMYRSASSHVEVLTASVRSLDHFLYALAIGSDIITAPGSILKEWATKGMIIPESDYHYDAKNLKPIPYESLSLENEWQNFDISHPLTNKGIERFAQDWNALISNI